MEFLVLHIWRMELSHTPNLYQSSPISFSKSLYLIGDHRHTVEGQTSTNI